MRSAVGLDEQRGERQLAEAGEPALPAPPDQAHADQAHADQAHAGRAHSDGAHADQARADGADADQAQRRALADRLAAAADTAQVRRDLEDRARRLPPGHPSSAYDENGARHPPAPSLADYERPLPPLTDAAWSDHVNQVRANLDHALASGMATHERHTIDAQRQTWTAERNQIHGKIIAEIYRRAADVPCDRQAIMAGGLTGAGKSTVLEHRAGIDRAKYLTINPDDFKEILADRGLVPSVPGLSPMEASALAHRESSYLARRLALRAMADGKNIIWDITMSSTDTTSRRIDELRNAEYKQIDAIFVDIPLEVSVARAEQRHRRGHDQYLAGQGLGGRCVPADVSRSQADTEYGSVNRRAFEALKDRFDHWALYDNSVPGQPPTLVDQGHQRPQRLSEMRSNDDE
jgi:predicted kinase